MFWNGSTAIDGLSGRASTGAASTLGVVSMAVKLTRYTRTGRAMFLRACSPRSSKAKSSLSPIWSRTVPDMQIPPGSAIPSNRAATFTPSP